MAVEAVAAPEAGPGTWRPCEDCDRREASVYLPDAALCHGCASRREAGEPRKLDLDGEAARAGVGPRFRFLKGYHNAEIE
jgi:hypothetical protein